ncbi:MAG: family 10 glycosylhydrolase [Candidatus Omnitrophota bacterium]
MIKTVMKRYVSICILALLIILARDAGCEEAKVRLGLFVTVLQEPAVLSSRAGISALIDYAKKARVNVLFVQVYRANQAWFPSIVADAAPYNACLKEVRGDPLGQLINEAHAAGIEVHAWMNMLSLGANKDAVILKKYGTDILTKNRYEKSSLEDYKIDGQYFLEPGDPRVRRELTDIVGEILSSYPSLDGIQYDYIRYPDKDPAYGYTDVNMHRFKEASGLSHIEEGSLVWDDWKRGQVTEFLGELAEKARSISPDIQVSATGCAPYSRAYHEAFQDWPYWIESGLVDFVTVMSYTPDSQEFEKYVLDIKNRGVDLKKVNIAIGAYEMAGTPASFASQLELCKRAGEGICTIFHYGSLVLYTSLSDLLLMWYNDIK